MIDLRHPPAVLATRMPWDMIEGALAPVLAHKDRAGRSSIIWSSRKRKKSAVLILESPRNPAIEISFSGDLDSKIHAAERVFMRGGGHLQGRLP
ncbi:MAG: hypothetical protein ABI605_13120 [Rhizobacter sp.]